MNRLILAVGAAALALPSVAVFAGTFGADSVAVRTDDLDLSTPDGRARLHQRVARSADTVCGRNLANIHLMLAERARQCRADTIANLEPRLNAIARRQGMQRTQVAMNR